MNQPTKVTNKLITSTIVENSLNSSFFFIFVSFFFYIYLFVLQIILQLFDLVFKLAAFFLKNLLFFLKIYYLTRIFQEIIEGFLSIMSYHV